MALGWNSYTADPTARYDAAAGVVSGILYVVGGYSSSGVYIATNNGFNPATNTWTAYASDPTGRYSAAAGVINGILYVVGGSNGVYLATNSGYNASTNAWTNYANDLTARQNAAGGVVSGVLYVVGGYNATVLTTNNGFNPTTNAWTAYASDPTTRYSATAGVVNGVLYVVGGNNNGSYLTTNNGYNSATNAWTAYASDPTARNGATAGVVNGVLYVVGGYNGPYLATNNGYNPTTNAWTNYTNDPTARQNAAGGVVGYTLYVVGGANSSYLATNNGYSVASAPNAPTLTSPGNTTTLDTANGVGFASTYSSTDGAGANAYALRLKASTASSYSYYNATTAAWQSTVVWNTASVAPGNTLSVTTPASSATADGASYNWSMAYQESYANLQGPFASDFTFTAAAAPTVVVTGPTGTQVTQTPLATWTTTPGSGLSQTAYEVKVESGSFSTTPGSGTAVYDSGVVSSSSQQASLPALSNAVTYRVFVQVTETGGVTSSWAYSTFTINLDPPAVPSVTAGTGTDAATGFPVTVLTVAGHDNVLSANQASIETDTSGWSAGPSTVLTQSSLAADGAHSLAVHATVAGTASATTTPGGTSAVPVTPSAPWTALASFRGQVNARTVTLTVNWLNSAGSASTVRASDSLSFTDSTNGFVQQGWANYASDPTARQAAVAGVVNGVLYVVGGYNGSYLATNNGFNPATNTWTAYANDPTARQYAAGGVVNGVLYVVGGTNGANLATNNGYSASTNAWTNYASDPTARYGTTAGVVNGVLYVVDGNPGTLATNNGYKASTNAWGAYAADPTGRAYPTAGVVNGVLYVVGGYNGSNLATNNGFNPSTNAWASYASDLTARNSAAAGVVGTTLYVVGGYNGSNLTTNNGYNPATNAWANYASDPTATSSPMGGVVNGVLYVVGGYNGSNLTTNNGFANGLTVTSPSDAAYATVTVTGAGLAAPIGAPAGPAVSTATTGGSIPASTTRYYKVTAVNTYGESVGSAEVSVTTGTATSTNANTLTWTALTGASSYNVYAGTAAGAEHLEASGITGTSYTDTAASLSTTTATVPTVDTTGEAVLVDQVSLAPGTSAFWTRGGLVGITTLTVTRGDGQLLRGAGWNATTAPVGANQTTTLYDYEAVPTVSYTYTAVTNAPIGNATVSSASSPPSNPVTLDNSATGWWEIDPTSTASAVRAQPVEWHMVNTEQSAAHQVLGAPTLNIIASAMGHADGQVTFETFDTATYTALQSLLTSQRTVWIASPWGPNDSGWFRFGPATGGMSSGMGNQVKNTRLNPSGPANPYRSVQVAFVAQPRP